MRRKNWISITMITMLFVFALVGCSSKGSVSSASKKVKIVAAENFYGEIAEKVGGDYVEVKSIINSPTQDPHEYEATTNDSRDVADAKLVIYNGIGYDAWMEQMVKSNASGSKQTIAVATDIANKKEGDNVHIWYNPTVMPKLAEKLAEDLAAIDPEHADEYRQRAKSYLSEYAPIQAKIEKLKQPSVSLDASETVFNYMAEALQYKIQNNKFAAAVSEETDPSPADIAAIQNDIKEKKITFFVNNTQNTKPTVDNLLKLAKETGIPVVNATETKPEGKTYIQWMMDQLDQVEKAVKVQ